MQPDDQPQVIRRQFGFWSACALGCMTGSSWPLFVGTITLSLNNGGSPGMLYETIAIALLYIPVSASIAELTSAVPSSAGVYHWASITAGPRFGRVVGFFAGWWNCLAYSLATVTTANITATQAVQLYALFHDDYQFQRWHVYIAYLLILCLVCAVLILGHHHLAPLNDIGLFWILAGVLIIVVVCAVMPSANDKPYTDNKVIWTVWDNRTGWSDNGLAFLAGMLNSGFSFGVVDAMTHVAEEADNPSKDLPKAIFAQLGIGFVTVFAFLLAVLYGVGDLSVAYNASSITPIASIYQAITGSRAGAAGLLIVTMLPCFWSVMGAMTAAGRSLWTLGRSGATPFEGSIGRLAKHHGGPSNATLTVCVFAAAIGCIYIGSTTALSAFATATINLLNLSYFAAIAPNLLSNRSMIEPGYFWMRGWLGFAANIATCLYIVVFGVIFCFPPSWPVTVDNMNWSSVIVVGLTVLIALFWIYKVRRGYVGPGRQMFLEGEIARHDMDVEHGDDKSLRSTAGVKVTT